MPSVNAGIGPVVSRIVEAREAVPAARAVLAAVTGIDASGKGCLSARILEAVRATGLRAACITIDGWLELPRVRFAAVDPGGHFYRRAIRFEEMFERLVLPLRDRRSIRLEADFTEETATAYRRHLYEHHDLDVVLLEGIFLLKREHRTHFDLSAWIDCSFQTALARALLRAQEGQPPEETERAYRTIYFPAQEVHLARDAPRGAATLVVPNDPLLTPAAGAAPEARGA